MRLPLLARDQLTPEQQPLDQACREQVSGGFTGFKTEAEDGALLGPWGVLLHEPQIGHVVLQLTQAVSTLGRLGNAAKQVAILTTGAKFRAAYELYAHARVGEAKGLSVAQIATIAAGQRPSDLEPAEAIAYDVASALLDGGVLPDPIYDAALDSLGKGTLSELVYLVGLYSMVAVLLNAYDVPGEERGEG